MSSDSTATVIVLVGYLGIAFYSQAAFVLRTPTLGRTLHAEYMTASPAWVDSQRILPGQGLPFRSLFTNISHFSHLRWAV